MTAITREYLDELLRDVPRWASFPPETVETLAAALRRVLDLADAYVANPSPAINAFGREMHDTLAGTEIVERCPKCRHTPHTTLGFCPNMASDNDCPCDYAGTQTDDGAEPHPATAVLTETRRAIATTDEPTTEDRPMPELATAHVLYFPADDDGNPDSWQVQAGEYADEPDLVIVIEHAVDAEGGDCREFVARLVAALLRYDVLDHDLRVALGEAR